MHTHKATKTETRGYSGGVSVRNENRAAHGGVCYVETCSCGAVRHVLVNGRHTEEGEWSGTGAEESHAG